MATGALGRKRRSSLTSHRLLPESCTDGFCMTSSIISSRLGVSILTVTWSWKGELLSSRWTHAYWCPDKPFLVYNPVHACGLQMKNPFSTAWPHSTSIRSCTVRQHADQEGASMGTQRSARLTKHAIRNLDQNGCQALLHLIVQMHLAGLIRIHVFLTAVIGFHLHAAAASRPLVTSNPPATNSHV